tara:strand:- start:42 stop:572 length:531 start_codon:yes stop_codon:yes gene_type:complete
MRSETKKGEEMKLELKKIKVCKWASEETHCYQATLYRDGVPIIEVSNDGHGGSDSQWAIKPFENNIVDEVEDWCKKNLPKWKGHNNEMYDTDLEIWCNEQVNKHLVEKDLQRSFKKDLKNKILFVENDKLMQFTWKKCKELTSQHFEYFKSKYPKRDILNLKNKDLAFKLYKKHMI